MAVIEYVYSAHSAFAYLGSAEIQRICADHDVVLVHRPILLSPVVEAQRSPAFRKRTQQHAFTHVDSARHFDAEGKTTDDLTLDQVMQARP